MKTAISIPDDLYAESEVLARRLNLPLSRLYVDAMREYLTRHRSDAITEALNRVFDELDEAIDPAMLSASRSLLQRVEW